MPSRLDALYLASPRPIQHVLVSLKGLQLERDRRRGRYPQFRRDIESRDRFTAAEFSQYQSARLSAFLEAASRSVPHYRDLGIAGRDLQEFPVLQKSVLRASPDRFLSGDFEAGSLVRLSTTGTTGTPLTLLSTHEARQENYAHFDAFLGRAGLDNRSRRVILGGKILQEPGDSRPPFWRHSWFQNAIYFSSYHMDGTTIPSYLDAMARWRPAILEGYPSALYELACHALARGDERIRPLGATTSSETLLEHQRATIETAFKCKVFDQYGSAEMAIFAGQCLEGRYHLRPDYAVVELLCDGRPAAPGEAGDVICTGLLNPAMPLIRYAIGDRAIMDEVTCVCGLRTPVLSAILGRNDDVIVTPEGRQVGRLSPVLKGFPIQEAQYLQDEQGTLIISMVPAPGFDPGILVAVEAEVRKRVGPSIPVTLRMVESIPRGPGGKFRAVISRFRPGGARPS